jgi:hypothetical protein
MTKLCKDCKWCEPLVTQVREKKGWFSYKWVDKYHWEASQYVSPKACGKIIKTSLITGEETIIIKETYCKNQRHFDNEGNCGPEGKFFEPKENDNERK